MKNAEQRSPQSTHTGQFTLSVSVFSMGVLLPKQHHVSIFIDKAGDKCQKSEEHEQRIDERMNHHGTHDDAMFSTDAKVWRIFVWGHTSHIITSYTPHSSTLGPQ